MEQKKTEKQILPRKKIWEIDSSFKCSVIGTCMTRSELRKLSREKVYAIAPSCDDYQLHMAFIGISKLPDLMGKSLHKYLEKKYRSDTRKYFRVTTDDEIEALWDEDILEGRIHSAWWGVITHPQVSMDLVNRLYGQLHMMGHDSLGSSCKKKKVIEELKSKVTALEEVLAADRQMYLEEKRKFKEQLSVLAMENDGINILIRENQFLREKLAAQKQRYADSHNPAIDLNQRVNIKPHDIDSSAKDRIVDGGSELQLLRDKQVINKKKIEGMKKMLSELEQQKVEQATEIDSLEKMLLQVMNQEEACEACADQDTEKCPGRNLCGRTVLYVGGLNKMVPHYRQMVENLGGCFIHHDGGKEVSRNILPKMLFTADAVLCPIDCVSHDACNCVKKICKQNQKPFVLMRSASLSSLARGLTHIVQQ
ncbi:MAG: DUF2325 domain-containing protein [Desulforhopalus sp.]